MSGQEKESSVFFTPKESFTVILFIILKLFIFQTNYENSSKQLRANFKPYLLQLLLLSFFVAINYSGDK